jgi:hypothetical protein
LAKVVDPSISNGVLIENGNDLPSTSFSPPPSFRYSFFVYLTLLVVLVDPVKRAKGYGRVLMDHTEAIAIK